MELGGVKRQASVIHGKALELSRLIDQIEDEIRRGADWGLCLERFSLLLLQLDRLRARLSPDLQHWVALPKGVVGSAEGVDYGELLRSRSIPEVTQTQQDSLKNAGVTLEAVDQVIADSSKQADAMLATLTVVAKKRKVMSVKQDAAETKRQKEHAAAMRAIHLRLAKITE